MNPEDSLTHPPSTLWQLLGYECRAKEQVTGLLRLEERTAALTRAQATGDTDLILTVLQHVKRTLPLGDFLVSLMGELATILVQC